MKPITIVRAVAPLNCKVRLPGSKSLTNRALVMSALADGRSTLAGALFCDDTEYMIACLQALGVKVQADPDSSAIVVEGCGGQIPATDVDLFCGNSGTTIRFCTALCSLACGSYRLDGTDRMRERPIGDLVEALRSCGAVVGYEKEEGYPPVIVKGGGVRGSKIAFDSVSSSQFVSALLMVSPYAAGDMFVSVDSVISAPYLAMTTHLMDSFGVSVVDSLQGRSAKYIVPAPQRYQATDLEIEPDASNASYFLAAPAIAGGRVVVEGLGTASIQGDVGFVDVLERMGCVVERGSNSLAVAGPERGKRLTGIDVDLNAMPDVAQTLGVVAVFAEGPTTIKNIGSLRVKETDRLQAMAIELQKLGAEIDAGDDWIRISPPSQPRGARIATYDDHRMAMSFSLAGLAVADVEILDPDCVNKTFPDYFSRFGEMVGQR